MEAGLGPAVQGLGAVVGTGAAAVRLRQFPAVTGVAVVTRGNHPE
jgi:hypothetical protein